MKKTIGIIVVGIIFYTLGYFSSPKSINNPLKTENRLSGNYQFINPLLECNVDSIIQDKSLTNLKNKLRENYSQDTSIYFRDMNNGPWFGINEKELFSPASLIKVPLMIAYLKKAEKDPSIFDKKILNTSLYNPRTQNIQPRVTLAQNQTYTVRQLIEQMIIYSDDTSYNLLNSEISANELLSVYDDLGVDISLAEQNPNGNILSVKAYASFFRILFNASYLNKEMSEYALKILSQTDYKDGLNSGIPSTIQTAHKFGERQYLDTGLKQLHDCGIIYLPKKPYLLCIMTRGNNFDILKNKISNISKEIYIEISSVNN